MTFPRAVVRQANPNQIPHLPIGPGNAAGVAPAALRTTGLWGDTPSSPPHPPFYVILVLADVR